MPDRKPRKMAFSFVLFLFNDFQLTGIVFFFKSDAFVKSQKSSVFVIPANAGIQGNQPLVDSRVRGSDGLGDFLRDHQICNLKSET